MTVASRVAGKPCQTEHMPTPKASTWTLCQDIPPDCPKINTANKFGQLGRREQHTFAAGNALADHTSQQCRTFQGKKHHVVISFAVRRVTPRHEQQDLRSCTVHQEKVTKPGKKKRVQPCDLQFVVEPQMDRQTTNGSPDARVMCPRLWVARGG